MVTEERTKEIIRGLHDSVLNFKVEDATKWAQTVLDEGVDPFRAIMEGLTDGMLEAGERYEEGEYFVPQLLICSDALYAGLNLLRPAAKTIGKEIQDKGSILIGVIEGDIHDIGKDLVKLMFDVAGWTVYDLGRDVKIDKFVEEQKKVRADVIGISALMTTSMLAMPIVVEKLKEIDPNVRIMLGGAPITKDVTQKYGADGTAPTAGSAVQEAVRLLKILRSD